MALSTNLSKQSPNPHAKGSQAQKKKDEIFKMINLQESVFKERARFFIIKSHSKENLELSMTHSIWATTKNPTNKF